MTTPRRPPARKPPAKSGQSAKSDKPPAKKARPPAPRTRRDPWDRLPDESDPAWEAFRRYRDAGANRSTAKVAQALGKSKTLMDRWSRTHGWVARARAYESFLDREWQNDARDMRRKAARRNATAAALAMQKFGEWVMTLDAERTSAADMTRLALAASQIERAALGMDAPGIVGVAGDSGAAVDATTIAGMSDEDRHARLRMLLREAQARLEEADPHEFDDDDERVAG